MEFLFRLGLWISGRVVVDLAEVGCTQRWCLLYFALDVLAIARSGRVRTEVALAGDGGSGASGVTAFRSLLPFVLKYKTW